MNLIAAWVGFPLAFGALVSGWGLLVEIGAGRRLPGPLVPGAGFAALVVALDFPGFFHGLTRLALPLGVAGAVAGLALCAAGVGPRGALPRVSRWPLVAALGTLLIYAAPTLFSGEPSVGGFIRLDDSATWTVLGDYALTHGTGTAGLVPSTHNSALQAYLPGHYPVGAFLPLAATGRLIGIDLAWAYSSYLAAMAAILALALYELAGHVITRPAVRAGIAICASCSGLLYGYVGWGGIKEIVAAALMAILAALAPGAVDFERGRDSLAAGIRSLIPISVAAAAILGALSVGGAAWVVIVLLPAFAVAVKRLGPVVAAGATVTIAAFVALGSLLALGNAGFGKIISTRPTDPGELLGNLFRPLRTQQVLGIWPAGDFRLDPNALRATSFLLIVLVVAALVGIGMAAWARAWPLLGYGVGVVVAAGLLAIPSSPWIDAKLLALASPAPVLLALIGIASLERSVGRALPIMLALLVAGGVAWTDVRAYQTTTVSPHSRHAELQQIAARFSKARPTLMTEYDPWGARWFLRKVDGEGASELRYRVVPLLDGSQTPKGTTADVDAYQLAGLLDYQALVLRRSPTASRPSSAFRLAWTGRWYEVWLRRPAARPIVEHLGFGGPTGAAATPGCVDVARLAKLAGPGGKLAVAQAANPVIAGLDGGTLPAGWTAAPGQPGAVKPAHAGTVTTQATVPAAGRYDLWIGGGFKPRVAVSVDGSEVAVRRHELQYSGLWIRLAALDLAAGTHSVAVKVGGPDLHPGSAGEPYGIGPVAFSPVARRKPVLTVPAAHPGDLCHRPVDWIEALQR